MAGLLVASAVLIFAGGGEARDASAPIARFEPSGLGLIRTIAPGGDPFGIAFTKDGRRLAVGVGQAVVVYETERWQEERRLTGLPQAILGIAWSPDGSALAAGGFEGAVAVWDVPGGKLRHTLAGHTSYVGALAFSADGKTLVTGSYDGSIRAWDAETGQDRRGPKNLSLAVYSVAFSRDGGRVVFGLATGESRVWRVGADWQEEKTIGGKAGENVTSVVFTRDGSRVVSATETTLTLTPLSGGEESRYEIASSGALGCVRLTPDDRYAIVGGADMGVRLYDLLRKGQEVANLRHHTGSITGVAVHPSGRWIATIGNDHHLKIWGRVAGGMARVRPKGFCGIRVQPDAAGRIVVSDVIAGTAAHTAGLQAGDVLKSVGGLEIHNPTEAVDKIGSYLEGEEVEFSVERGGESKTYRIKLGKRPADLEN